MAVTHELAKALRLLDTCSSTHAKMQLIQETGHRLPAFCEMLQYALDPYRKYGFKVLPVPQLQEGVDTPKDPNKWGYLKRQLDALCSRSVTGNEAKALVSGLLCQVDLPTSLVLRRVLLKDLRCGVGATLVNKVFPGLVPEFGVMLAAPLEEKHLKKLQQQKVVYFQPKKNGDRSVHIISTNPQAYSRNGHEQCNYGHITQALRELCNIVGKDLVFDGEVIQGDFWGTRTVKKKRGNEATGAVLHVFDVVPYRDWSSGHTAPFGERRSTLKRIWHHVPEDAPLVRVPSYPIKGSSITWSLIEGWRQGFVDDGEEGLIIRLNEPYNFKTRSSLFKFKKMVEEDFMILEIREGEKGKKYEGMAAKVLVDLGDGVACEVGLQGDMEFRKDLWKHRNHYAGSMCEVHYQEKTCNKQGVPKLQFGIMVRLREDKN